MLVKYPVTRGQAVPRRTLVQSLSSSLTENQTLLQNPGTGGACKANMIRQCSGGEHTDVFVEQGLFMVSSFLIWRKFTLLPRVLELL